MEIDGKTGGGRSHSFKYPSSSQLSLGRRPVAAGGAGNNLSGGFHMNDPSSVMDTGSEKKKVVRKWLPLNARILALVALVAFVFFVTRLAFDGDSPSPSHVSFSNFHTPYGLRDLWTVDTLSSSSSAPHQYQPYLPLNTSVPCPFKFCPTDGESDALSRKYGSEALGRTRLFEGSGERVKDAIRKAMAGRPVTIGVLGGSVSACHGLPGDDPLSEQGYPRRLHEWWNSIFPHPANELTNGAARRTNTAYFSFCSAHHLPDNLDLVILEFDADDPNHSQWMWYTELLVRSLLNRPDHPAVVFLGHFSPQIQQQYGFSGSEIQHSAVATYYDVPHISTKGILYNEYIRHPDATRKAFYIDPILPNSRGHELLADTLIAYLQRLICEVWTTEYVRMAERQGRVGQVGRERDKDKGRAVPAVNEAKAKEGARQRQKDHVFAQLGEQGQLQGRDAEPAVLLGEAVAGAQHARPGGGGGDSTPSMARSRVPPVRLFDLPSDLSTFREPQPWCVTADDLINPLPPSIFADTGWSVHHPSESPYSQNEGDRHYWVSREGDATLKIPIRIGSGEVVVYYLQGPREAAKGDEDLPFGNIRCWVDDNYDGAVELRGAADIPMVVAVNTVIDRGVAPGAHFVECQMQGEPAEVRPFKILGIFAA